MNGDDDGDDLSALEDKIDEIVGFCQSLRAENKALRDRIAGLEEERGQLVEKIDTARARLEVLLEKLPQQ